MPTADARRCQRRVAEADRHCRAQRAIVRIEPRSQPARSARACGGPRDSRKRVSSRCTSRVVVRAPCKRHRALGGQPAVPAVTGQVHAEPRQGSATAGGSGSARGAGNSAACRARATNIAGQRRDVVPIGVVRRIEDHRVVRRAAAERAGARIVDALRLQLRIAGLACRVLVVPHEEVPAQGRVFRRRALERGDVVSGQTGAGARHRRPPPAPRRACRLPPAARPGAAAGARADDHVVAVVHRAAARTSSGIRSAPACRCRAARVRPRRCRCRSNARD